MRVLVACEFSGVVRDAFRARGHDAWSCDLLPAEDGSPFHYQCDVRVILPGGHIYHTMYLENQAVDWDLMIAHPPCTYLCNSGVSHLHKRESRWADMQDGAIFFRNLLYAPVPKIAIENPIMHKYAKAIIGEKQTQLIQPWMFGHGESKATCLWLRNLPKLIPTHLKRDMFAQEEPVEREQRLHKLGPSPDRWRLRSITYQGIANAMADQWGSL